MKHFSATDAKNRFGELMEAAGSEPVAIQKNGKNVRVLISAEEYDQLLKLTEVHPKVQVSLERSLKRWDKVYEALAK